MKKINLKNLLKRKAESIKFGTTPAWPIHHIRDWKILVYTFAIGLIAISIFSWQIYLSNEIAGGYLNIQDANQQVPAKAINLKKLQADLLILETRQTDYLKIKANPVKLVDPSL
jgi:hypothetical protein